MSKPKIAIIGASIAGAACAILLHHANFDITVFEQRKADAADECGVGLALPCELVEQLKQQELFDRDFNCCILEHRDLFSYDRERDQERLLVSQPTHINTVNWSILYQQLKKRLPKKIVAYDCKLIEIVYCGDAVKLIFDNGQIFEFDYVIFADGHQSLGRIFLFPEVKPEFAGYIAWRTAVTVKDTNKIQCLIHRQPLYGYSRGIGFAYLIPAKNKEDYVINCLIYEKITEDHPLFRGNFEQADRNITANLLPESYLNYYRTLVQTEFPPFARDLFSKGVPFIQTIRDTLIDQYYQNRMLLIGDASTLLRPVTGSGATKGLQDTLALINQLKTSPDLEQAFETWGRARAKSARELYKLGKALSDFYVMDTPNWDIVTSGEIQERWDAIIKEANWYITQSSLQKKSS